MCCKPCSTPTPAPTTPTPIFGGEGTCWKGWKVWPSYVVTYAIDPSVKSEWHDTIHAAAQTWNNVRGSKFRFVHSQQSQNIIRVAHTWSYNAIAEVDIEPGYGYPDEAPIEKATITINKRRVDKNEFSLTDPPGDKLSLRTVMLHEFGHWIYLHDILRAGCGHVLMWHKLVEGQSKTITTPDAEGLLTKYP